MKNEINQKEENGDIFDKTYHKLYLEERDKRLAPFDIPELLKEKGNKYVSRLSELGIDIPPAGDLEKEYFLKAMGERNSEVMAVNELTNKIYGNDFDEANYDHDEYLKDKELINEKIEENRKT
jgi:hypothetical protein